MAIQTAALKGTLATAYGNAALYGALYSAVPGASAGTELSGGTPAYARKALTWTGSNGTITATASSAIWAIGTLALNPGAATNPIAVATVTSDIALIDATTSTPGGGGTLSYTITPTTGTTQIATGKFTVPRAATDTTYTVTVTEFGSSLTGTTTAVSPAKVANTNTNVNVAVPKSPSGTGSSGTTWA